MQPYLYKIHTVKAASLNLFRQAKHRWKMFMDKVVREAEVIDKRKLQRHVAELFTDEESYNRVAKAIGLPEILIEPRGEYFSSVDTLTSAEAIEKLKILQRQTQDDYDSSFYSDSQFSDAFNESAASLVFDAASVTRSSIPQVSEDVLKKVHFMSSGAGAEDGEAFEEDDMVVHPPTPPPEKVKDPWVDRRSPYQKFFSLPEYKATRWRKGYTETKPRELLTVQEREEELYDMLAADFCQWMAECQFQEVRLDKGTITDLFQVGMETPAAKAMCAHVKELPVVPRPIAKKFNAPEKSEMAGVRDQVYWDAQVEKKNRSGRGVKPRWGTTSKHDRVDAKSEKLKTVRPEDLETKWFSTDLLRKELRSGEVLWSDLEKTKIFKHFCNWMQENPKYERPDYLSKKGYFKQHFDINEMEMTKKEVSREEKLQQKVRLWDTRLSNEMDLSDKDQVYLDPSFGAMVGSLLSELPQLATFLKVMPNSFEIPEEHEKSDEWNSIIKPLFSSLILNSATQQDTLQTSSSVNQSNETVGS